MRKAKPEERNSQSWAWQHLAANSPNFVFLFSFFVLLSLAGCGAPGVPTARTPPIPAAVADLQAQQSGDGVELRFSLPQKSIRGEHLIEPPAVEIIRDDAAPYGALDAKSFRIVYTVPGALVKNYQVADQVQFLDPIDPAEVRAHPGELLAYRVRTRASSKKDSADSNTVTVAVFPVTEKISSLQANVTEDAVELTLACSHENFRWRTAQQHRRIPHLSRRA